MLVVVMVLMMMVLVFMVVVILILGMTRPKTVSVTIKLMIIAIVMMMVTLMKLVMLILQSWKKKIADFFYYKICSLQAKGNSITSTKRRIYVLPIELLNNIRLTKILGN